MKISIKEDCFKTISKLIKPKEVNIVANKIIQLISVDKNIAIIKEVKGDIFQGGNATIPFKLYKALECGECLISDSYIESDRVKIKYNQSEGEIYNIDYDLKNKVLEIKYQDLVSALECRGALAKDETRAILKYIYANENELVALDGYRMSIRRIESSIRKGFFISPELVKIILKIKYKNDIIRFFTYENKLICKVNDLTIIQNTNLEIKKFVNYNQLREQQLPRSIIRFNKYEFKEFFDTLNAAKEMLSDANNVITIKAIKSTSKIDMLEIKYKSLYAEYEKLIPITLEGNSIEIAFNNRYMLETLKNYHEDLEIKLVNNIQPIVIEKDEKFDLILPIRIIR